MDLSTEPDDTKTDSTLSSSDFPEEGEEGMSLALMLPTDILTSSFCRGTALCTVGVSGTPTSTHGVPTVFPQL